MDAPAGARSAGAGTIAALRAFAFSGLERMYDRDARRFVFRLRRASDRIVPEGFSDRYAAITAIGLAHEDPDAARTILAGERLQDFVQRAIDGADRMHNLGDLALTAWAGAATGCNTHRVWERIRALRPDTRAYLTVEVAWVLSACAMDPSALVHGLGERIAQRLRTVFVEDIGIFPHLIGGEDASKRSHVSCFADLVYPTLALSQYGAAARDRDAIAAAARCADFMCRQQGASGQWWWHFDYRTGRVLERYPVYAVHQDSMAPRALFAASSAAGTNYDTAIARGLSWLWGAPELGGRSLVDEGAGLIWRKVARREPAKLSRYMQAAVSRVSPHLRAPGLDTMFPPTAIDFEDRPYHLGWVLFAWPRERAAAWPFGRTA